jgi:hypothetical protein
MNKKMVFSVFLVVILTSFVMASQIDDDLFIKKGWNLVYGYTPSLLEDQNLEREHIKAVYAFIPTTQEYARVYPDLEDDKIDLIGDGYLADTSFWVYSDADFETRYSLQEPMPLNLIGEHNLYEGWNFFGITPAFTDKRLEELEGSCNILKAHIWNARRQEWINLPLTEKLDEGDEESKFGGGKNLGLLLKVSSDCSLEFDNESDILPPPIPTPASCSDSDGGINYAVKGNTLDEASGNANYTDVCTNQEIVNRSVAWTPSLTGNVLVEYYCGGNNYLWNFVDCSKEGFSSCSEGRCIN